MKVVPVNAVRTYGGVEVYLHIYLTSTLNGQLHSPAADSAVIPSAHLIRGWVGP